MADRRAVSPRAGFPEADPSARDGPAPSDARRLLVLAVGNPSRGDDALGPLLLDALAREPAVRTGAVELLGDFQLQVEHALDLVGRPAVLFVDAELATGDAAAAARLLQVAASDGDPPMSHALRPQALLAVCRRALGATPPPAWQLALPGDDFTLGALPSARGRASLAAGLGLARHWLASRGAGR